MYFNYYFLLFFLKELSSKIIINNEENDRDNTSLSESLGNYEFSSFLNFTI